MRIIENIYRLIMILGATLVVGCQGEDLSDLSNSELKTYVSKTENGLLKTKSFGGVNFSAKVVPNQLMENVGDGSTVILVTLSPEDKKTALYFAGVNSFAEFKDRNQSQYFEMSEYFYIRHGDRVLTPSHCIFEHNYGVTSDISFYVQFEDLFDFTEQSSVITLIYRDVYYAQGIMSFDFDTEDIMKVLKSGNHHG